MNCMQQTLFYVINTPYFWASMGLTTAIAMFIGVLTYDGNVAMARKGIVSICSYAGLLLFVTFNRITFYLNSNSNMNYQAYAGIITIFIITFFYLLGLVLGVSLFKIRKMKV